MEIPRLSTIRYTTPKECDMAICFVLFNSSQNVRMISNYLYTVEKLRLASIPYYTIEMTYGIAEPEIADAIHVKSNSYMFHKERLCSILERHIPAKYKKIMFLDADLIFENPDWYDHTSMLLNCVNVVQPFNTCTWLDITYTQSVKDSRSFVFMDPTKHNINYHPGFAWAFQREWYKKVGFFEYTITGSGDSHSAYAWVNCTLPEITLRPAFIPEYMKFLEKIDKPPSLAATPGRILHMWHGTRENRGYVKRHLILDGVEDVRSIITENSYGCFEFKDIKWNEPFKKYFDDRQDDGI